VKQNAKHNTVAMNRVFALALIALAASVNAWAGEKVILNFNSTDGQSPTGNLIADGAGNLYGVTYLGGIDCAPNPGCGLVFRLSKASGVTVKPNRPNITKFRYGSLLLNYSACHPNGARI
jgi:hypothetical protein